MELVARAQQLVPDFSDVAQFNGFTANKKKTFLELFTKNPNVTACAQAVGVVRQTIFHAAERDPAFKAAFDAVKDGITDDLEARVAEFGQRPQNFMDRIAWLRARRPEVWNPKPDGPSVVGGEVVIRLQNAAQQYVDAQIVPNETKPSTPTK